MLVRWSMLESCRRPWVILSLAAWLGTGAGCQRSVREQVNTQVTGIKVTVHFNPGLSLDQLEFSALSLGQAVVQPQILPETPKALDPNGVSVVIVLPDDMGGRVVKVRADGLAQGTLVASAQEPVTVVAKALVTIILTLGDAAFCGDGEKREGIEECDDQNTSADDGCSDYCEVEPGFVCNTPVGQPSTCVPSECTPSNCTGCCAGSTCFASAKESCGINGNPCLICGKHADACSPLGSCSCGGGPGCDPGQYCVDSNCVCNAESCPGGCCQGTTCVSPPDASACGTGGGPCRDCGPKSNVCALGECKCGDEVPCGPGQACENDVCVCNADSCPSGCCDNGHCRMRSFATCGTQGDTCKACDPLTAETCSTAGECRCSGGAACAVGMHCTGAGCVCDSTCPGCCSNNSCIAVGDSSHCGSGGTDCEDCLGGPCAGGVCTNLCNSTNCADGCCSGSYCEHSPWLLACAVGGLPCRICDNKLADDCTGGACTCNGGTACNPGQRCALGACVCDLQSCPDGCCSGTTCVTALLSACGSGGGGCVDCNQSGVKADDCVSGSCVCGAWNACGVGQICASQSCACDTGNCASGCCDDNTCVPQAFPTCGLDAVTCEFCDLRSDCCSAGGACACGGGQPCEQGQRCDLGTCVCDPTSCPMGCCSAIGAHCVGGTTDAAACGRNGGPCVACPLPQTCAGGACSGCNPINCGTGCCSGFTCSSPAAFPSCVIGAEPCAPCGTTLANACSASGDCLCGAIPACLSGQECLADSCHCTASSCASGCCSEDSCDTSSSLTACGILGQPCAPCAMGKADACVDGVCSCGRSLECGAGQVCSGMSCACDVANCQDGCCSGNTCVASSDSTCGTSGGTCKACTSGQHCVAGSCVCDPTSCSGCCDTSANCQPGTDRKICGLNGEACQKCNPKQCVGGVCQ